MIKRKKGFTLIELLAVILIIGILAIIAIPSVNKVLENAEKSTLKSTVNNIQKALVNDCQSNIIDNKFNTRFTIKNGVISPKIEIESSLPENGIIIIDEECKVSVYAHNNKFCVTKDQDDLTVNSNIEDCLPKPTDESLFLFDNGVIDGYKNGGPTDLVIPETINGETVTEITDYAFFYEELTSLYIPPTVTFIGNTAFNENLLPDSQALIYARNSDGSVDNTKIVSYGGLPKENLLIPSNVKTIGRFAFESGYIDNIIIPNSVTTLEEGAFYYTEIKKVTLPNSITRIEKWAFESNDLTSITIPPTVTFIGADAFDGNPLTEINMPGRTSNNLGTNWYEGSPTFNFD